MEDEKHDNNNNNNNNDGQQQREENRHRSMEDDDHRRKKEHRSPGLKNDDQRRFSLPTEDFHKFETYIAPLDVNRKSSVANKGCSPEEENELKLVTEALVAKSAELEAFKTALNDTDMKLEALKEENSRLKEGQVKDKIENGKRKRSSMMSTISAALGRGRKSKTEETDKSQGHQHLESRVGRVKSELSEIKDGIKMMNLKVRQQENELKSYQESFQWLRDNKMFKGQGGRRTDEATKEFIRSLKDSCSGSDPRDIVSRLTTRELEAYLSLLQTELSVAVEKNKMLEDQNKEATMGKEEDGRHNGELQTSPAHVDQEVLSEVTPSEEIAQIPASSSNSKELVDVGVCTNDCVICDEAGFPEEVARIAKRDSDSLTNFVVIGSDTSSSAKEASSSSNKSNEQIMPSSVNNDAKSNDTVQSNTVSSCVECIMYKLSAIEKKVEDLSLRQSEEVGSLHPTQLYTYSLDSVHHLAHRCQKEFAETADKVCQCLNFLHLLFDQQQMFFAEFRYKMAELMSQKNKVMQEIMILKEENYGLLSRALDNFQDFNEIVKNLPTNFEDSQNLVRDLINELLVMKTVSQEMKDLAEHQLKEQLTRFTAYVNDNQTMIALLQSHEKYSNQKYGETTDLTIERDRLKQDKARLEERLREAMSELARIRKQTGATHFGATLTEEEWPIDSSMTEAEEKGAENSADSVKDSCSDKDEEPIVVKERIASLIGTCHKCRSTKYLRFCRGCNKPLCPTCFDGDADVTKIDKKQKKCQSCRCHKKKD